MAQARARRLGWLLAPCASLIGWPAPAAALFANLDYYWPGNPVTIAVCWENPAEAPAQRREWVRDAIDSSWGRHARVNFTEWDTCNAGDPGVHIRIDSYNAAPGGVTLDGVTNGVHLDLTYSGNAACSGTLAALEHCIRAIAVHEFGHVLGFYHEEERYDYFPAPGAPPACAKQTWPNSSPQYYGAYDLQSVMSYCGQPAGDPSTWKEALSPGDVAAVQRAYGRRIPGALVSPAGNCVAAHATGPDFESAFLWDCDEYADDQEWRLADEQGHFTLSINTLFPVIRRCLENSSNPASPQTFIRTCDAGLVTQRFKLESVAIRGWGGLCLDLQNGNTANLAPVQMWECGALGGINQRRALSATGEIRFGGPTGKCLTVPPTGTAYLYDCGIATWQAFDPTSSGELRLRNQAGRCLDVIAWTDSQYLAGSGLPQNGQRLQSFACTPAQLNQKWNLSGNVRHVSTDRCLARLADAESNGTLIQTAPCSAVPAQQFDYYFRPDLGTDDDADGIADDADYCPFFGLANQLDTDGDRRGNVCECTDQTGDGRNTVSDLVAINAAIFNPGLVTPLCDGNNDGLCNVGDIIAANVEIFSPGNTSTCARQPVPGP
jgi:hypothetical protein